MCESCACPVPWRPAVIKIIAETQNPQTTQEFITIHPTIGKNTASLKN